MFNHWWNNGADWSWKLYYFSLIHVWALSGCHFLAHWKGTSSQQQSMGSAEWLRDLVSSRKERLISTGLGDPYSLPSEKAMALHSSTLAWKIPWMQEPGRLQSMGSLRVGHDWATSLSLFTFMHWRRKWQSTPVFLPGESQGWGSLVGCHLRGCTESDTTEAT